MRRNFNRLTGSCHLKGKRMLCPDIGMPMLVFQARRGCKNGGVGSSNPAGIKMVFLERELE